VSTTPATVVPGRERRFRKFRKIFLAAFPRCLYRLNGCTSVSTVVDHFAPTSIAPGRAWDPHNFVPCCRACHQYVTDTFDAVGGIVGNTRKGKPDPRTEDFHELVEHLASTPAASLLLNRRLPDDFDISC